MRDAIWIFIRVGHLIVLGVLDFILEIGSWPLRWIAARRIPDQDN